MFNIILAQFKHETNTFSSKKTDFNCYLSREYVEGEEILRYYAGTHSEMGGFLDVLAGQDDVRLIPSVAANAIPAGPVTADVWRRIRDMVLETIGQAEKADAVLLCLHGAMVTELSEDGEGDLLAEIRAAVGADVPIMATLDLHANITEKMLANCDVFCPYRGYPHADLYERGLEAANLLLRTLRGEIKPVMRWAKRPFLVAAVPTAMPAMQKHVQRAAGFEKEPGVLSVSIGHGFFCADILEAGLTTLAVTDGDAARAQEIADALADGIWADRALLQRRFYTPEEAIEEARRENVWPVIFADVADNPGGGSTGDGTHLLRAMLKAGVRDAAVALICDPESVAMAEKAGVGNVVHLRLGGKQRPEILGGPIECDAYVKSLNDGKYINDGPMGGGMPMDLQKTAVVVVDGIEVIVSCNVTQTYDVQVFRSHGIEPRKRKIVVVKSAVHFRAAFEPLAKKVYDIECPGLMPQNPKAMTYTHLRRPIYPLDEM